jgi:hypothetical protein
MLFYASTPNTQKYGYPKTASQKKTYYPVEYTLKFDIKPHLKSRLTGKMSAVCVSFKTT